MRYTHCCNLIIDLFTNIHILFQDTASALPLSLDRSALRAIDPNHVLILKRRSQANSKFIFYRNILPDLQITYCPECLLVSFCLNLYLYT